MNASLTAPREGLDSTVAIQLLYRTHPLVAVPRSVVESLSTIRADEDKDKNEAEAGVENDDNDNNNDDCDTDASQLGAESSNDEAASDAGSEPVREHSWRLS